MLMYRGKEHRCLSRLKWAEKNVKEQNLLWYCRTYLLRIEDISRRQGGEGGRGEHIRRVRIAHEVTYRMQVVA